MRPSHVTGPMPRGTIGNNSIEELSNEDEDNANNTYNTNDVDQMSFKHVLDER